MTTYARIRAASTTMAPIPIGEAQVGSLFLDTTNNNALSFKSIVGDVAPVSFSVSVTDSVLIKRKQNKTGVMIPGGTPAALKPDGSMAPADSDGTNIQVVIGVTQGDTEHMDFGSVLLNGPNASGALAGLGFAPGDAIMLSSTPGVLTNTTAGIDPATMTIMKVGIADCASGVCSGIATDLIMEAEVISRPSGV